MCADDVVLLCSTKSGLLQILNICKNSYRKIHKRIKYRIKPDEELYILSCEKGRGRRPRPVSQLRM